MKFGFEIMIGGQFVMRGRCLVNFYISIKFNRIGEIFAI